jgi:hypothetical protein
MIKRVWLMFSAVWFVFTLLFGTLSGPDTWKDRAAYSFGPLLIGLLLIPIVRNLQFRRIHREFGRRGVYVHLGLWVFVLAVFLGPATANDLGYPGVRDKLIWVLAFFLYVVPVCMFLIWLTRTVFTVLRWLARQLRPASFSPSPSNTLPPER